MNYIIEDFQDLAELKDGWFDGDGKAYDHALLERGGRLLAAAAAIFNCPKLYIYPMPDRVNCVSVEFDYPENNGVVLTFNLQTLILDGFIVNTKHRNVLSMRFDLTDIAEGDIIVS